MKTISLKHNHWNTNKIVLL